MRATTTLTLSKKGGPITATSVIESVPVREETDGNGNRTPTYPKSAVLPHANLICDMWQASPQLNDYTPVPKQHSFQSKTVVMPDTCGPCEKRIRFGKTALKCKNCRAVCHPECKDKLPVPCIPCANTPTHRIISVGIFFRCLWFVVIYVSFCSLFRVLLVIILRPLHRWCRL